MIWWKPCYLDVDKVLDSMILRKIIVLTSERHGWSNMYVHLSFPFLNPVILCLTYSGNFFSEPMSLAMSVQWHSFSQKKNYKYLCWTNKLRGEMTWKGTLSGLENPEPGFLSLWVSVFIQKLPQFSSVILNKNSNGSTRYVAPIAVKCLCSESYLLPWVPAISTWLWNPN